MENLTPVERTVLLAADFYFQVSTHGIDGFYQNATGSHAVETVEVLERLGIGKAADVLRQCNAAFPDGSPPTSQTDRARLTVELVKGEEFPDIALEPDALLWNTVYDALERFIAENEPTLRHSASG
jgi:hypothetical protein